MEFRKIPSRFQWKVYLALQKVPRGKVITYKGLAARIGIRSARAVGGALAKNPLPVIIPCHRVVSSNREIGGFSLPAGRRKTAQDLKKDLLKSEGITFDKKRRIPKEFFI